MTTLTQATCRRLQKLPLLASVWEGDRRSIHDATVVSHSRLADEDTDCILWVDGREGIVRAMDMVNPESGPEAVVRTLIRAIENPLSTSAPARPQKIVVRNREMQFFLRGVLQDLGIQVEYVADLPLIDEIFRGMAGAARHSAPQLPERYAESLENLAKDLWQDAPWEYLEEHQIIAIEINHADIGTLYLSVLGMMGMEYGALFYRSLDSLRQFRLAVLEKSDGDMESAFLQQDCLFITFEAIEEHSQFSDHPTALSGLDQVQPSFGNLHPLEGMRSVIYEEEAIALMVGIEALHRFLKQHKDKLTGTPYRPISSRYRITLPASEGTLEEVISVQVKTLPEVAQELADLIEEELEESEEDDAFPPIQDDLVPDGSIGSIGVLSWDQVEFLRLNAQFHQATAADISRPLEGLPAIVIQTSRPKAKDLINHIQEKGGLQTVTFNLGADPYLGELYDLGILQTGDGELHLFCEFDATQPQHQSARQLWEERCRITQGVCGVVIAMGVNGKTRGNPQLRDMLGFFETNYATAESLGMEPLTLDLDLD